MINKEAIELLEGVIKYYTKRNGQSNAPMYVKQQINQALALLKEQPPASEFTEECRKIVKDWGCLDGKESNDLCDRLDASEASRKALVEYLVELVDIIDSGSVMDTFTTKPAIAAIKKHKQGD